MNNTFVSNSGRALPTIPDYSPTASSAIGACTAYIVQRKLLRNFPEEFHDKLMRFTDAMPNQMLIDHSEKFLELETIEEFHEFRMAIRHEKTYSVGHPYDSNYIPF